MLFLYDKHFFNDKDTVVMILVYTHQEITVNKDV